MSFKCRLKLKRVFEVVNLNYSNKEVTSYKFSYKFLVLKDEKLQFTTGTLL